jgi:hypothetical protein
MHSPEKVGRDAGVLAGGDPCGITVTDDMEALIALESDCVIYAAAGPEMDAAAVPDYLRFLEAGINVSTVTSPALVYPPAFHRPWTEQLTRAAEVGGATLYASGIEPGFAGDFLPLVLATQSNQIRSIRTVELFLYDTYPVTFLMKDAMGFGMPSTTSR